MVVLLNFQKQILPGQGFFWAEQLLAVFSVLFFYNYNFILGISSEPKTG